MNRPTKVKVGALDYEIRWHDKDWHDSTNCRGEIVFPQQRINLADDLPPQELASTFLHEVIHAILQHYDRAGDNRDIPISRENVCEYCSYGIQMVWRDNPEAFEWWQGLIT
jgi:hypothetical protein